MDKKSKRDFLRGFGMVSAGAVAATGALAQGRGGVLNDGGYPPGVPHATGRSMLDSPHYIGTASKGYGFKANWARTLPMVPSVDPNYKPRRINKAIELWEDNQVVAYAEFGALIRRQPLMRRRGRMCDQALSIAEIVGYQDQLQTVEETERAFLAALDLE